jgi:hypothetical protein
MARVLSGAVAAIAVGAIEKALIAAASVAVNVRRFVVAGFFVLSRIEVGKAGSPTGCACENATASVTGRSVTGLGNVAMLG